MRRILLGCTALPPRPALNSAALAVPIKAVPCVPGDKNINVAHRKDSRLSPARFSCTAVWCCGSVEVELAPTNNHRRQSLYKCEQACDIRNTHSVAARRRPPYHRPTMAESVPLAGCRKRLAVVVTMPAVASTVAYTVLASVAAQAFWPRGAPFRPAWLDLVDAAVACLLL